MPFGILIRDMDGRILKANKKFKEYFHTDDRELVGLDYNTWKESAWTVPQRRTADGNLEIDVTVAGETSIYELHEDPVYDMFHSEVGRLCIARDVTIERTFEQKILHNANTDALTGLYNRRYFYEYVGKHRGQGRISLLYVDLDNFKQVNDRHGHQTGDEALIAVARLLRDSFPDAMIARVGGDEFLITKIGPCDLKQLEEQARRFLRELHRHCAATKELRALSASIGITHAEDDSLKIDDLIRQSDTALYVSKYRGKSRYTVYTPDLERERKQSDEAWRSRFRAAIKGADSHGRSSGKPSA